jgi:hypothetical protein
MSGTKYLSRSSEPAREGARDSGIPALAVDGFAREKERVCHRPA